MKIVILGWYEGFNKVQFNKFLRKEYGYSIGEAKAFVDDILNETEVSLKIKDLTSLDDFNLNYKVEKETQKK